MDYIKELKEIADKLYEMQAKIYADNKISNPEIKIYISDYLFSTQSTLRYDITGILEDELGV